jgi:hypothetical protein
MSCIQAEHHACRTSRVEASFVAMHFNDSEFVLQATVQLIATVSGTMIVCLKLFVFHPLLAPFIKSYYILTLVTWLLAFSPCLGNHRLCYV